MEQLPAELIEKISVDNRLSIQDVINLSLTCRRLQDTIRHCNAIWRIKFHQLNPLLKNKLKDLRQFYYDELKYLYKIKKRIMPMLEEMSVKFYRHQELSNNDLKEWNDLVGENWNDNNYFYIVQELLEIVNGKFKPIESGEMVSFNTPGHLTQKYYARKVLRGIRRKYLTKMWHQYIRKPPEKCLLEEGATIMAQWFQCNDIIELENISGYLDEIAAIVKRETEITYYNSPLSWVSDEQMKTWRTSKGSDNNWKSNEICDISQTIGQVLFHHLNFQICGYDENSNYDDFFINKALQTRRAILPVMAIIYEAVARRLGVRCEISMNSNFCSLWFCATNDSVPIDYYINLNLNGKISKGSGCPFFQFHNAPRQTSPANSPDNVIIFLVSQMRQIAVSNPPRGDPETLSSTLEFQQVTDPNGHIPNNFAALYMWLNVTVDVGIQDQDDRLSRHCSTDSYYTVLEPVKRPPNDYVKFAVGMVMEHKRFSYKCVIFNWDKECVASPEWISNSQIPDLKYGIKQPFYNVIVDDCSFRYVAQENLIPYIHPTRLTLSNEHGRYFSHFHETYFVPNVATEKIFPEDREIRKKFHDEITRRLANERDEMYVNTEIKKSRTS